jgi:UDP-N-acetylmuramate--alanine ligase
MIFGKIRHIHFVGIGGIGMSGIAEVLVNLGYLVSGSDLKENLVTQRLKSMGIQIYLGHSANYIENAQVVVVSSAIQNNNPEVLAAKNAKIPVIPRGEMLAELMRMKYGIAIAGSHGKTTTTSMIAQVLSNSGIDPTIVIGGKLGTIGSNAKLGNGKFLVAEADESDGSFLMLSPTIGVITNVDLEHVDYYKNIDDVIKAFTSFGNKIPFYGSLFICTDDPNLSAMRAKLRRRVITYGTNSQADIQANNICANGWRTDFQVQAYGNDLGLFSIGVPGNHMVLNALATIGVAIELGLDKDTIYNGLSNFTGAERRFQKRGEQNNIIVIDDYGHHPTEIVATLKAARQGFPNRRIVVAFQPHRYTRINALIKEFSQAFKYANKVLITDIYAAGEQPITGINGRSLSDAILASGSTDVSYVAKIEDLPKALQINTKPGDVVITMGAGSITSVGASFLTLIETNN